MLDINHIYNMEALNFLKAIDDNIIDLAVIDPPYNLSKADWDRFSSEEAFFSFTKKWIDALLPKLKENGSLYIFNTPYNSAHILAHLMEKEMIFQNWITWDKRDGLSAAKRKYNNGQETILFFTKNRNHTFNYNDIRTEYDSQSRMAHASKMGIIKNGKRWYPNPDGKLCGEVWHFTSERHKNKVNGKTTKMEHITPKPMDMIERIIKASSNKGDLVLDCFVGMGTTAIAAQNLSRNFICNDKNKNYVSVARKKLKFQLQEREVA